MSTKSGKKSFAARAAGAEPSQDRGDEFAFGKWRVNYTGCNESDNGAFCFRFAGAGKDAKIGDRIAWLSTTGKASYVTEKAVKRLAMILVGTDDPNHEVAASEDFINALVGGELEAMAELIAEHTGAKTKAALAQLSATEFVVRATKGGEKDDGSNFVNVNFAALGDADDESEGAADEDDAEPESEAKPRAGKKASKRAPVEVDDDDDDAPDSEEDEVPDSEEEPPRRSKKKSSRR